METKTRSETIVEMRRAQMGDIERLLQIAKDCFPKEPRWRGPRALAWKWWQHILESDYCEVWVCMMNEDVVGYINLVQDIDRFYKVRQRYRGGLKTGLYLAVHDPLYVWRHVSKHVTQSLVSLLQKDTCTFVDDPQNNNRAIWIRHIAIGSAMQGRGYGSKLIEMAVHRAYELGYNRILLSADRFNTRAISLYQRRHFIYVGSTKDYVYFERKTDKHIDIQQKVYTHVNDSSLV